MRRSLPMYGEQERWNHNIHYHPLIVGTVPPGSERGLDVGCGEGILARELRRVIRHVVAIDLDELSIDLARQQDAGAGIEYIHGDFLSYDFEPASFDVIVSVAALHHMKTALALERMRQLLRPGGKLAIIGLARSRYPVDLPIDLAGTLVHRVYKARRSYWEHSAPTVWPPPETYAGMRRIAIEMLPGARYRRHLLWRYSLIWTRPA